MLATMRRTFMGRASLRPRTAARTAQFLTPEVLGTVRADCVTRECSGPRDGARRDAEGWDGARRGARPSMKIQVPRALFATSLRYEPGVFWVTFLNERIKWCCDWKPQACAICSAESVVVRRSILACSTRTARRYDRNDVPVACLKMRLNAGTEKPALRATPESRSGSAKLSFMYCSVVSSRMLFGPSSAREANTLRRCKASLTV